jgi:hypothetical protein
MRFNWFQKETSELSTVSASTAQALAQAVVDLTAVITSGVFAMDNKMTTPKKAKSQMILQMKDIVDTLKNKDAILAPNREIPKAFKDKTKGSVKVSEWLDANRIEGHSIYDAEELAREFKWLTGHDAVWTGQLWTDLAPRVIASGGYLEYNPFTERYVGGDSIIALLHDKFCTLPIDKRPSREMQGRGSRARQKVEEIRESGN